MPLGKRIIREDICLRYGKRREESSVNVGDVRGADKCGDRGVSVADSFENSVHTFVRQLQSLVLHSDDLFNELVVECDTIVRRSLRIKDRITALTSTVLALNAREVHVPEGNLTQAIRETENYRCSYGYDVQLFQPSSRPTCIKQLHKLCDVNPVHDIRRCNLYRIDGKSGSSIFSMQPTITNSESCWSLEKFWSVRTPTIEKHVKSIREPKCSRNEESSDSPEPVHGSRSPPKPSDRIRQLSHSQPILIVPVDVSGQTFHQLCQRRSRSHSVHESCNVGARGKKKLRRNGGTFSSAEFVNEAFGFGLRLSDDLRKKCPSRERWDRARCTSQEINSKSKGSKVLKPKFLKERSKLKRQDDSSYCLWRKSLCSVFKSSEEGLGDFWIESQLDIDDKVGNDEAVFLKRSQSLPRSFCSSSKNAQKRVTGSRSFTDDRTSPIEYIAPNCKTHSSSLGSRIYLHRHGREQENLFRRTASTSVPHVLETGDGSREVIVHIPEQPWTRPFATVKLRPQSSKVEANSYQTSSGNWSADSACHSMLSDTVAVLPPGDRHVRHSLDKDSAYSEINHFDRFSEVNGHPRSSLVNPKVSVNHPVCSNSDLSLGNSATELQDKPDFDNTVTADEFWTVDDGISLYSVDQDGFYTSMHADSGLSRTKKPSKTDGTTLTPCDELNDSNEISSTCRQNGSENDDSSGTVVFFDWIPSGSTAQTDRSLLLEQDSTLCLNNEEKPRHKTGVNKCLFAENENTSVYFGSDVALSNEEKRQALSYPSFCTIPSSSSDADGVSNHDALEQDVEVCLNSQQNLPMIVNSELKTVSSEGQLCENLEQNEFESLEKLHDCISARGSTIQFPGSSDSIKSILKSKKTRKISGTSSLNPPTLLNGDTSANCSSFNAYKDGLTVKSSVNSYDSALSDQKICKDKTSRDSIKLPDFETGFQPYEQKRATTIKKDHNRSDTSITDTSAYANDTTGFGYLGSDAITTCTGVQLTPKPVKVDLTPASAKLVITSPVTSRTKYVENPHKRLQCTSLATQALEQSGDFSDQRSWLDSLSRKSCLPKKISEKAEVSNLSSLSLLDSCGTWRPSVPMTEVKNTGQFNDSPTKGSLMSSWNNKVRGRRKISLSSPSASIEPKEHTDDPKLNPVIRKLNRKSDGCLLSANSSLQEPLHCYMSLPRTVAQQPTPLFSDQGKDLSPAISKTLNRNDYKVACKDNCEKKLNANGKPRSVASAFKLALLPDFLSSNVIHSKALALDHNWQTRKFSEEVFPFNSLPHVAAFHATDQRASSQTINKDSALKLTSYSATSTSIPLGSQDVITSKDTSSRCNKKGFANSDVFSDIINSATADSSPDLVPRDIGISKLVLSKSQDSISSILSASEYAEAPKPLFLSCKSNAAINKDNLRLTKFAVPKVGCRIEQFDSVTSNQVNPETESRLQSCKRQTIAWISDSDNRDAITSKTISSLPQKQSFESDSSGLGSSAYNSTTVSPDTNMSVNEVVTFPATICLPQSCDLISPDVIPLIARTEVRHGLKVTSRGQDSLDNKAYMGLKQTPV